MYIATADKQDKPDYRHGHRRLTRRTLIQLSIKVSGRHSGGVTPVPIPNTAVKPSSADGTVTVGVTGE